MDGPDPQRRKPSIYDVAARAGVSHMTVSRVLNEHPNIKAETRDRVRAAIAELSYTRSTIARALATNRAMRIGVLVDAPLHYGPSRTLLGFERAARARGYAVSVYSVEDEGPPVVEAGVEELLSHGADALAVVAPRASSLDGVRRTALGVPLLLFRADPDPDAVTVSVAQAAGVDLAIAHLVDIGHREILHIAGPTDWYDARSRTAAWEQNLRTRGLVVRTSLYGDWSSDSGFDLASDPAPWEGVTAAFVANDQMALGVIHGLRSRGVRVPEDVSVVGFDDVPDAGHFWPPLTTVRQDYDALGRLGVERLMDLLSGSEAGRSDVVEPRLIVRRSTAALAH